MEYLSEYILSHIQKPFYKKYLPCPNIRHEKYEEQIISRVIQQTIAKILMDNPNPHVINIYEVNNDYVLSEKLDTKYLTVPNLQELIKAKRFLQSKGIILVDWSPNSIGLGSDGKFKVFNFDCAGLVNPTNPDEWIFEPVCSLSYRSAIISGYIKPIQIDDYCFTREFGK